MELQHARHATTNNYGQLAPSTTSPARDRSSCRDSYVESQMNDYRDTLQVKPGTMPGMTAPVYGMGVSGCR